MVVLSDSVNTAVELIRIVLRGQKNGSARSRKHADPVPSERPSDRKLERKRGLTGGTITCKQADGTSRNHVLDNPFPRRNGLIFPARRIDNRERAGDRLLGVGVDMHLASPTRAIILIHG